MESKSKLEKAHLTATRLRDLTKAMSGVSNVLLYLGSETDVDLSTLSGNVREEVMLTICGLETELDSLKTELSGHSEKYK